MDSVAHVRGAADFVEEFGLEEAGDSEGGRDECYSE